MKLRNPLTATGWAYVGLIGVGILVVAAAWWIVIGGPAHDRRAAAGAKAGGAISAGAAAAGHDALNITDRVNTAETGRGQQLQETKDDIASTKNAGDPAGDAGLAGLRGLCKLPANRSLERCRQLLEAGPQ